MQPMRRAIRPPSAPYTTTPLHPNHHRNRHPGPDRRSPGQAAGNPAHLRRHPQLLRLLQLASAEPLRTHQKFELAWRSVLDPVTITLNGISAGIEQATNAFPGYGQGAAGYFKRFGAANADTAAGTFLGGYLYPVIFRQDPRYFYLGHGSITHRALYALSTAFRQRGDNGKWQPAYASILGDLSEGAVSNLYYPASDRHGATLTFENGLISIGSDAVGNLIQEFLLRHLTRKPPTYPAPESPASGPVSN